MSKKRIGLTILLFLIAIVLIPYSYIIDARKPFDPSREERDKNDISIGVDGIGHSSIMATLIDVYVRVEEEDKANAYITMNIQNVGNITASPTFIFVLPRDATNISGRTVFDNNTSFIEETSNSKVAYVKLPDLVPYGGTLVGVDFEWPHFSSASKHKVWDFYLEGTSFPLDMSYAGSRFHPIIQPSMPDNNFELRVIMSVNPTHYRIGSYHPSIDAMDFPSSVTWIKHTRQFIFLNAGTYYDDTGINVVDFTRQSGFLSLGAAVALVAEDFTKVRRKRKAAP